MSYLVVEAADDAVLAERKVAKEVLPFSPLPSLCLTQGLGKLYYAFSNPRNADDAARLEIREARVRQTIE